MQNFTNSHEIDKYIGQVIRERRIFLGKSQSEIAECLGVSFQQLQKYETGANRIGASRLFQLSKALKVPVAYFFFGLPEQNNVNIENFQSMHNEMSKEATRIYHMISSITDNELKAKLIDFLKRLAQLQNHSNNDNDIPNDSLNTCETLELKKNH